MTRSNDIPPNDEMSVDRSGRSKDLVDQLLRLGRRIKLQEDGYRRTLGRNIAAVYALAEGLDENPDQLLRLRKMPGHEQVSKVPLRAAMQIGFSGVKQGSRNYERACTYSAALRDAWNDGTPASSIQNLIADAGGIENLYRARSSRSESPAVPSLESGRVQSTDTEHARAAGGLPDPKPAPIRASDPVGRTSLNKRFSRETLDHLLVEADPALQEVAFSSPVGSQTTVTIERLDDCSGGFKRFCARDVVPASRLDQLPRGEHRRS